MNNRSRLFPCLAAALLATASLGMAQDEVHPWRSATDADQPAAQAPSFQDQQNQNPPAGAQGGYSQAPDQRNSYPPPQSYGVPSRLTIKPGTFVTVRINQWLSSDRNRAGDAFSATLAEPLIVDGIVVAQRGQTVAGRVTEAQKAGRVEGTSRLGIQLTDLTLADGQPLPVQSQMINRTGPTSVGRDVGAVAGTTALGAAIGAAVGWGKGAAIGAGAGAAAGIIGVLVTRGRPTVVYPESVLTFRIEAPVDFSTDRAPQAFRYVDSQDYGRPAGQGPPPRAAYAAPGPYGAPAPYPYAPAPYYGYPYGPYYYGPGISIYAGPGFYFGPRYYGGFYRFRR